MKPFQLQSYYEVLEVPVSASTEQIRAAYERLSQLYVDDQVALYGLADSGSAQALRAKLLEAMEILTDEDLRVEYDKDLGLPPRQRVASDEDDSPPAQLAMNDLLTGADRALQSTHPYVPFSYVSGAAAPPPPEVPPPVAVPPPVVAEPTPTPPPPPAVVAVAAPPPPRSSPLRPRPSPAQAPRISATSALALAETGAHQAPKDARASAPRPKPPELPPDAEFNGELLRRVRTHIGLSVHEIAEKTRISARHIENIEADRYKGLPAAVYLRGFLISLSRELGLDGLKVSKSYLALVEKAKG